MSVKSILCIFSGAESEKNSVPAALGLSRAYGARIGFLHVSQEPSAYVGLLGEGVIVSAEIYDAIEKENKARLQRAREYVVSETAKHNVPLDSAERPAHHASAVFKHIVGVPYDVVSNEGRVSDLIVVGKSDGASYDVVAPALFNTGRPVLIVPPAENKEAAEVRDKIVAVAWNGNLQAARALYNSFPLIRNAEKIYVLTAQKSGEAFDLEAESGLMEYLNEHGLQAQCIVVAAGQRSIGEALLTRARELQADLLIMGAYHHSTFREMILGGVTEYMLENSEIPLLLSH